MNWILLYSLLLVTAVLLVTWLLRLGSGETKLLNMFMGPAVGVVVIVFISVCLLLLKIYAPKVQALRIPLALILPGPLFGYAFALAATQLKTQSQQHRGIGVYFAHFWWLILLSWLASTVYGYLLAPLLEKQSTIFVWLGIAVGWMIAPLIMRSWEHNG